MTIASQTNKHLYSGDGAQTVFPYTFKAFAASDLVVIRRAVDGTETTLALTTHYTVSGVGSDAGGNVTLVGTQAASPPAVGEKLLVKRVIPLTQPNDLVQDGPLPEPVIEGALDRLVCIAQQLQEQIGRAVLTVAETSTTTSIDPDQIAADAATASAAAAAAATFDPALYVPKTDIDVSGTLAANSDTKVPSQKAVKAYVDAKPTGGKWTALVATTDFATTAASTSTITMNTNQTANIKAGMAIKFTLSGTVYYAIVSAITSNLLTIAGAPLTTTASALTALSYGLLPPIVERIAIPGYWADAADTALLANDLKIFFSWKGPTAYLVQIKAKSITTDSGASKPRINARLGGTTTDYVCTANSNAGLEIAAADTIYSSGVDIDPAKYFTVNTRVLELKTDGNGSNDDAADLTVELTFVVE